jgi:hypothetical protein
VITYGTPGWDRLAGRFAIPESEHEARAIRLAHDEVLPLVETLQETRYGIKAALAYIGPIIAQSPDGAIAEHALLDALKVLEHLTEKRADVDPLPDGGPHGETSTEPDDEIAQRALVHYQCSGDFRVTEGQSGSVICNVRTHLGKQYAVVRDATRTLAVYRVDGERLSRMNVWPLAFDERPPRQPT